MEIRKNYDEGLLRKIDSDFLSMMIDENDDRIDDKELHKHYIKLFSLLSQYQKL